MIQHKVTFQSSNLIFSCKQFVYLTTERKKKRKTAKDNLDFVSYWIKLLIFSCIYQHEIGNKNIVYVCSVEFGLLNVLGEKKLILFLALLLISFVALQAPVAAPLSD